MEVVYSNKEYNYSRTHFLNYKIFDKFDHSWSIFPEILG
jgi:hypothetical protein